MSPNRNQSHKSRLKITYLGKFQLNWSDQCNIPLLSKNPCDICSQVGRPVLISPPGDVRPAFQADLEMIQHCIDTDYGEGIGSAIIVEHKVVLLNRIGGLDKTEEVIVDGNILGIFLFDPLTTQYKFHPHLIGGKYIHYFQKQLKNQYKKTVLLNV